MAGKSITTVLRSFATTAKPTFAGANLRDSNKPVQKGKFVNGTGSGPLVYWAHSDWVSSFDVGLHPHQGHEIHSFVWRGEDNAHFDTAINGWVNIPAGGMQVLRTRSGMSHAEKVCADARVFQIWFDPGFEVSKVKAPSYDVYPPKTFTPSPGGEGLLVTNYVGPGTGEGSISTDVPGLFMARYQASIGGAKVAFSAGQGRVGLLYMLGGSAAPKSLALHEPELPLTSNDTMILGGEDEVDMELSKGTDIFVITVPQVPEYQLQQS